MSMTKGKLVQGTTNPSRKQLLRLVRLLLRGECEVVAAADGMLRLGGSEERVFAQDVVRQAQSLGLARRLENRLSATDAAAGFLRRALVTGEEEFGHQHRDMVDATVELDNRRQPVRRNLAESPLGVIARMKDRQGNAFLPPEATEAGERLLADFTRGQMQPRITASWEPRLSGRGKGQAGGRRRSQTAPWRRAIGFHGRWMPWARNLPASPWMSAAFPRGWKRWSVSASGRPGLPS
jgi:hypothetical protein